MADVKCEGCKEKMMVIIYVNPIQVGIFGNTHGWGEEQKRSSFPEICHTYTTMMKHDTVIRKEDTKHI